MSEERDVINITVSGIAGSGKSRLTYLLKEFLKEKGLNVNMAENKDFESEAQFDEFMSKNTEKVIKHFSETKTINIKEVYLNRNLSDGK